MVDKSGKCKTSADAREEAKFSIANNFITIMSSPNFKLTTFAGVVAASTQTKVFTTFVHIGRDEPIALAV